MKKGIEHQEMEFLKVVFQAWHSRNSIGSPRQDSGEFDAQSCSFKINLTRFRIEGMANQNKLLDTLRKHYFIRCSIF